MLPPPPPPHTCLRPSNPDESADDVLTSVSSMLAVINVTVDIERVERKQPRVDAHPGVIIVTLRTADDKRKIFRAKSSLKQNDDYSRVYIEPDRSRQDRIHDANMRRIVGAIPNLRIRNGIIQNAD